MYFNNKTDEIKTILNRLEQLVLKAEQDKNDMLYKYGDGSLDYNTAEAYEAGAFAAYAIVRKIIDGDIEWKKYFIIIWDKTEPS